jgi:hypothetical protein
VKMASGGDAEDPVGGAVQVHVAAEDGGRRHLVVIEVDGRGGQAAEIFLEFAVGSADQHMGDERAVLVVRSEPFRTAGEDVLGDEWPFDELGGDVVSKAGAAGAEIAAACAFKTPVLESQ